MRACLSSRGISVAVAILAVAALLAPVAAQAECPTGDPASVLECYAEAYRQRDVTLVDELLAEDYLWIDVSYPGAMTFDRDEVMRMAEGMFGDENVTSAALVFDAGGEIVVGSEPGTWRIEGAPGRLEITFEDPAMPKAEPVEAGTCFTLYVREVDAEGGGSSYQIYREVTFGDGGCDGEQIHDGSRGR